MITVSFFMFLIFIGAIKRKIKEVRKEKEYCKKKELMGICEDFEKNGINIHFDCLEENKKSTLNFLNKIPVYIINTFSKFGFSLKILDRKAFNSFCGSLDIKVDPSYIYGFFWPKQKIIAVCCSDGDFDDIFFHEFGHFIDFFCGGDKYLSDSDAEITEIFKKEQIFDDETAYYFSQKIEFTAHMFSEYFKGNHKYDDIIEKYFSLFRVRAEN